MKFSLGESVYHKSSLELAMIIVAIDSLNPKLEYTCCYYNEVTGKFENSTFYEYELITKDERYK